MDTPSTRVAQRYDDKLIEFFRVERHRQRMSQAGLAAKLKKLGHPEMTRSVIANLEAGRRQGIGFGEAVVISTALNVSLQDDLYKYLLRDADADGKA